MSFVDAVDIKVNQLNNCKTRDDLFYIIHELCLNWNLNVDDLDHCPLTKALKNTVRRLHDNPTPMERYTKEIKDSMMEVSVPGSKMKVTSFKIPKDIQNKIEENLRSK